MRPIRVIWQNEPEAQNHKEELCQYQDSIENDPCLLPMDHVRHRANRHDHLWRIYIEDEQP